MLPLHLQSILADHHQASSSPLTITPDNHKVHTNSQTPVRRRRSSGCRWESHPAYSPVTEGRKSLNDGKSSPGSPTIKKDSMPVLRKRVLDDYHHSTSAARMAWIINATVRSILLLGANQWRFGITWAHCHEPRTCCRLLVYW